MKAKTRNIKTKKIIVNHGGDLVAGANRLVRIVLDDNCFHVEKRPGGKVLVYIASSVQNVAIISEEDM